MKNICYSVKHSLIDFVFLNKFFAKSDAFRHVSDPKSVVTVDKCRYQ